MYEFADGLGSELGIRVTCQKCKKQIFRKQVKIDGFEPMPKGWKLNKSNFYHCGWWCPDCIKEYTI